MGPVDRISKQLTSLGRRASLSDETRVRLLAALLWALVIVGAVGGLVGWLRVPAGTQVPAGGVSERSVVDGWAAAGFGARFVAAFLAAGQGGEETLERFLGYSPDLPATLPASGDVGPTVVVKVEAVGSSYWAVTVAVGDPGRQELWRVGVAGRGDEFVAAGLPTPVSEPSSEERARLAMVLSQIPALDEPAVEAVAGWVSAYVCGQGDLARYLAPDVELDAVSPPMCQQVRLDRWGSESFGQDRQRVAVEAILDPGSAARRVAFGLVLARRDGRWEVAELLPALPLADGESDP